MSTVASLPFKAPQSSTRIYHSVNLHALLHHLLLQEQHPVKSDHFLDRVPPAVHLNRPIPYLQGLLHHERSHLDLQVAMLEMGRSLIMKM